MASYFKRLLFYFKYFDWILFLSALLLFFFGLAALYGIATGFDNPNFINFYKQIAFGVIGVFFMLAFSFIDYSLLRPYAYFFYWAMVIVLVAVLFFGITLKGTTGWLSVFGIFTFQPVEIAKISLIIALARFFSVNFQRVADLKFLIQAGILAGLSFILVFLQPDFGSALMLFTTWFAILLISGVKRWHLISIIGVIIFLSAISWIFLLQGYQRDRILTFINPDADPYGRGYQVRQAIIGVGSGQFTGRGLASGSQSQLKFIPASQTDFIYAVIAEELGFLGASLVLVFYFVFFYRLVSIAKRARDDFALYLVLGVCVLLFSQFFVNVGMNVGLLPVTGVGLPFVSYGGSFLVASFLLVGIAESVAIRSTKYRV